MKYLIALALTATLAACGGGTTVDEWYGGTNPAPHPDYNNWPMAMISTEDRVVHLGQTIHLDGSDSYDGDGDGLRFQWRLGSVPDGVDARAFSATTPRVEYTPTQTGYYQFILSVNDGRDDTWNDVSIYVGPPSGG